MSLLEALGGWLGQGRFAPKIVESRLTPLVPVFERVAARRDIPAPLLAAIAIRESGLDPLAMGKPIVEQGGQRALGLMQVTPSTARGLGLGQGFLDGGWRDPEMNIDAGAQVLLSKGLGAVPIRTVLARYGGFVTVDPTPYVDYVLTWAGALTPTFIFKSGA